MNDVNRATAAAEVRMDDTAASRRRRLRLPLMIGGVVLIVGIVFVY